MATEPWSGRFSASTRGRMIAIMRRTGRTVEELAQELDLTDNAIRGHLARLMEDGLVQQRGMRRGTSKPAYLYKLTPQAEHLFPRAYEEILGSLLDVLGKELNPDQVEAMLGEVGQSMAAKRPIPVTGDLRTRLAAAVVILNQLGGLMELEDGHDGNYYICGYGCPISSAVRSHPQMCKVMETMISKLVDAPVHERCERSESLSCWFEVPAVAP
jgi:predicted ArsR family transcriptional regulator